MPDSSDNYQIPSWPPTPINRDLWNAVLGSIGDRLTAREELEATFANLEATGIQASLDYIQVTIAPQIANLQTSITLAQQQLDQIISDGVAPNSQKLGGQLPSYYAPASALPLKADLTYVDDELLALATAIQSALDLKANATSLADKADLVATNNALSERVRFFPTGAALPTSNIGPIWHADYAAIMTWQTFSANGAAYTGYASIDIGAPRLDGQSTARTGWLKRNGGSYSKTTYAPLWNWALHNGRVVALGSWAAGAFVFADNGDGTFKVPDNRGEFERLWDDGRGVDSGRVFGSSQLDQMQQITGSLAGAQIWAAAGTPAGALSTTTSGNTRPSNGSASAFTLSFDSANSPGARAGSETRSRNVALLGTIKF